MSGNAAGATKTAAMRIGVTPDEYAAKVGAGQKWCGECRAWHPVAAFGVDRTRYDELSARCLASRVVAKTRPGARERRLKALSGLAWCRGCEQWLPMGQVSQGACRPHLNEEARGHYAKNPATTRARKAAYRRGLDVIPPWWREERFEAFGGLCAYGCSREASALDHVWPVSHGGKSRPSNLVPACTTCNSSKSNSEPTPWLDRFALAFPGEFMDFMELNMLHAGHFDPDLEVTW